MSKQQVKKIDSRIAALRAAVQVSRANAKRATRAKFRKLAAAKAERLANRIKALSNRLAA